MTSANEAARTSLKAQLIEWGRTLVPAIGSTIGFIGFVSLMGAAVVWMRYSTAGLPADQAVHDLPLSEWVATGAVALLLYLVLGLAAALLVYLLQEAVISSVLQNPEDSAEALKGQLALSQQHTKQVGEELTALMPGGAFPDPDSPAGEQYKAKSAEKRAAETATEDLAREVRATEQKEAISAGQGNQWGMLVLVAAELVMILLRTDLSTVWKVIFAVAAVAACLLAVLRGAFPLGDRKGLGRAIGALLLVLGILLVAMRSWTFAAVVAAVLLALANLAVGRLRPQSFFWYGIAIFVSVGLFGAVLTYSRDVNAPSAQAAAVLMKNGCVVRGLWIGESSTRVFLARLGPPSEEAETNAPFEAATQFESGRVFWLDRTQVASESVGKIERVPRAEDEAGALRGEMIVLNQGAIVTGKKCSEESAGAKEAGAKESGGSKESGGGTQSGAAR